MFTFLSLNYLYGQQGKEGSDWKHLFSRHDTINLLYPDTAKTVNYFLVQCPAAESGILKNNPALQIERQLDREFYILRANSKWISENHFRFVSATPANDMWKLSPTMMQNPGAPGKLNLLITVHHLPTILEQLRALNDVKILQVIPEINIVQVEVSADVFFSRVLPSAQVRFTEYANRHAREEAAIPEADNRVNTINKVHADHPEINGSGLVVSIKENLFDTTDIDFAGRIIKTEGSSTILSSHATNTATVIAGGGNSFYTGLGAAWGANISASDFKNLLPDGDAYARYGISVQNHSYGVGIENYYGSDAAAYDTSMFIHPSLIHIFSSGNAGDQSSPEGAYAGVTGLANITGSFKMSKNTIGVGSVNALNQTAPLSSKGPAFDGRLKPELVAYGESGSSEAAAIVSGIALLLQDAYAKNHNGARPPNALVKSVLISSANDVGSRGIDFSSGYGSADADRAVQNMLRGNFFSGSVRSGEQQFFPFTIPAGAVNLKITLTWNDPPASPNAFKALINDLDLEVTDGSGISWKPWVLSAFPDKDSLQALPQRKRDSLNVVEQVTIEQPSPGIYQVGVKAATITGTSQDYYVSYQSDTINQFRWTAPSKSDFMIGGEQNILRWRNTYGGKKGKLDYTFDNGLTWLPAGTGIDLDNNYFAWQTPDTFAAARVRMTIEQETITSELFSISGPLPLQVGFDCPDSLLLIWERPAGIQQFSVFTLNGKYLQRFIQTQSNRVVIKKNITSTPHFAVAPQLTGLEGMKSYTINSSTQGVGCYVKNFLADLQPDYSVQVMLTLGTVYEVTRITFEKQSSGIWIPLQVQNVGTETSFSFNDADAADGIVHYRAKIELENGGVIYTEIASIYKLENNQFLVFPNPLRTGRPLQIFSKLTQGTYQGRLFDMTGRKVMELTIDEGIESIVLKAVHKGVYVLLIYDQGKVVFKKKLVIW